MKKYILITFSLLFISCVVENINYLKPIMQTYRPSSVLTNSATLGGKVLGEGGKNVTEYGIVYSENFPPTINDTKIVEGERIGSFSKLYEGLSSNTTYYCAAYGINEVGVGYGEVYQFKTNAEPPCNPTVNNRLNTGNNVNGTLNIDTIRFQTESIGFNEGNMRFEVSSSSDTMYLYLNFYEKGELPLTGEYDTVYNFEDITKSSGKVMVDINDWGWGNLGGSSPKPGNKVYVKNDGNGNLTFIFCDVVLNQNYTLNGKFTY